MEFRLQLILMMAALAIVLIATAPKDERLGGLVLLLVPLPALAYVLAGNAWNIEANADPIAPQVAVRVLDWLLWLCPTAAVLGCVFMPGRRWLVAAYGLASSALSWLIAIGASMQMSGVYP